MRQHAEWLLRVYGDDLRHPDVRGTARATGTDTLALIERLLAEKDAPRYTLFNPGPVMTSARVKAAWSTTTFATVTRTTRVWCAGCSRSCARCSALRLSMKCCW